MHFVARSSTEAAYQSHGYTLRQDPLIIFRQPPLHISRPSSHDTPTSHRRTISGGSVKLLNIKISDNDSKRKSDTSDFETQSLLGTDEIKDLKQSDTIVQNNNQSHNCQNEGCKRIVINIAGQKYETQLKTLNRLPSTLLGSESKREKYWDVKRNEYFFDRHRPSFPAVLYYYQSGGRLKRPVEVPVDVFVEELEFYELGNAVINAFKVSEGFIVDDDEEDMSAMENSMKGMIWEIFEHPGNSVVSNVIALVSVLFILASVVTFCVETLPAFKNSDCSNVSETINGTTVWSVKPNYVHPLFLIETCCICWFVFELVIRIVTCPSFMRFAKDIINWIDVLSIMPYFIFLAMFYINDTCQGSSKILSVLRVIRVVRIFKLSRFSVGLQILGKTLTISLKELSMFVLFLGIGVVIFAGAIYYAEAQNEDSFFVSIPDAFWWAVISMTTVGYGDVYPIGVFGKIIGGMCVLSGLLAIALPVPVVVTNFNNIYRQTTGRGNNL